MKAPKVVFHLGVHKTATTFFQSVLWSNKNRLKEYGVNYLGLDEVRSILTKRSGKGSGGEREAYNEIFPHFNCDRLLISDENLLGGLDKPRRGRIYNNVRSSIEFINNVFDGMDIEAHIVIRNQHDYFISRYSEYLRHFDFVTYEEYYSELKREKFLWSSLIDEVRSSFHGKLVVHKFEDTISEKEKFLTQLTGVVFFPDNMSQAYKDARAKISSKDYEIIKMAVDTYGAFVGKEITRVLDRHKSNEKPFNPERFPKNMFDENYGNDLKSLL